MRISYWSSDVCSSDLALEGVIDTPTGHLDENLVNRLVEVLRVEAFGRAEGTSQLELRWIGVDGDDATCLGLACPLNRSEPDAAEAEDGHRVTRLNLGRVVNSADAGGHTATQQADMLGIGVRVDLGQRDFGHHRVFAEGRAAHVVVDRLRSEEHTSGLQSLMRISYAVFCLKKKREK